MFVASGYASLVSPAEWSVALGAVPAPEIFATLRVSKDSSARFVRSRVFGSWLADFLALGRLPFAFRVHGRRNIIAAWQRRPAYPFLTLCCSSELWQVLRDSAKQNAERFSLIYRFFSRRRSSANALAEVRNVNTGSTRTHSLGAPARLSSERCTALPGPPSSTSAFRNKRSKSSFSQFAAELHQQFFAFRRYRSRKPGRRTARSDPWLLAECWRPDPNVAKDESTPHALNSANALPTAFSATFGAFLRTGARIEPRR